MLKNAIVKNEGKMRFVLSSFLIMFCSSTLIAEQILYCATEQNMATGFVKKENKWKTALFNEKRLTVKFPQNMETLIIGNDKFSCQKPFFRRPKEIVCREKAGHTFIYNELNRRFIYIQCSQFSYTSSDSDTCVMFAGTCENF